MATKNIAIKLTDDQQRQIHEATGQRISELTLESVATGELSNQELENVVGGYLTFTFKLVAVKTVGWASDT